MDGKIDLAAVGQRIREAREAAGLNQGQVAAIVGGHSPKVSVWEQGQRLPDTEALLALSRALGVSVDYLLTGRELPGGADVVREVEALLDRVNAIVQGAETTRHGFRKETEQTADQRYGKPAATKRPGNGR